MMVTRVSLQIIPFVTSLSDIFLMFNTSKCKRHIFKRQENKNVYTPNNPAPEKEAFKPLNLWAFENSLYISEAVV